jgi:hypothetical protein
MTNAKPSQHEGADPDDLPNGSGPADETTTGGDDDQFEG